MFSPPSSQFWVRFLIIWSVCYSFSASLASIKPVSLPDSPFLEPYQYDFIVSGIVKDATSLEAVAGVEVSIPAYSFTTLTNAEGLFRIPSRITPPFELVFADDAYMTTRIEVKESVKNLAITLSGKDSQNAATPQTRIKSAPEQQITLALLQKIPFFFDWSQDTRVMSPDYEEEPFMIGIYRKNPFGASVYTLGTQLVYGKQVVINMITQPEDLVLYDMVFFPLNSFSEKEAPVLALILAKEPVLTVCADRQEALQLRAVVGVYESAGKMRVGLSKAAAKAAGVTPSADLLKFSEILDSGSISIGN